MTTVTDADREAAAEYFEMTNDAMRADFARRGNYDLSVCVQAFARHREQEVAKIVAYLKKRWPIQNYGDDWPVTFAINAIEAGEYRNDA